MALFGGKHAGEELRREAFETEILYNYTVDDSVQRTIDSLVEGQRGAEPSDRVRGASSRQDLSKRLRAALAE